MSAEDPAVRLFVALSVPADVREKLAAVQQELRDRLPPKTVRWTRRDNMHLTLRFLGAVASSRVESLQASLASVTDGFGAFQLQGTRLGCFPGLRYPRVLWAWITDGEQRLLRLFEKTAAATSDFAEAPCEQRFTGHVTLGRIKSINRPAANVLAGFVESAVDRRFGEWTASSVHLIRSELSPQGSRYTTLAEFPL